MGHDKDNYKHHYKHHYDYKHPLEGTTTKTGTRSIIDRVTTDP
jgi:hypothetical protein